MSSEQSSLILSAHTGTFFNGSRECGGTSAIEGGDGALEEAERLDCCSEITVQREVQIFLSIHIDVSFPSNFNCCVKKNTKYTPIRPIKPDKVV